MAYEKPPSPPTPPQTGTSAAPATRTETEALAAVLRGAPEATLLDLDRDRDAPLLAAVPAGRTLVDLKPFYDAWRDRPERTTGTATLLTERSFIDHVMRFRATGAHCAVFVNVQPPRLTAVFNYATAGGPDWLDHRALFNCPLSDEFRAWLTANGKVMTQHDFAAFLEDRICDIYVPADDNDVPEIVRQFRATVGGSVATASALVALSRGLKLTEAAKVQQAVNLSSGESTIAYASEHRDEVGGRVTVPSLFMIAVPVFDDGALYRFACRLRYRVKAGEIVWFYEIFQVSRSLRHALDELAVRVATQTDVPLFYGTPEE